MRRYLILFDPLNESYKRIKDSNGEIISKSIGVIFKRQIDDELPKILDLARENKGVNTLISVVCYDDNTAKTIKENHYLYKWEEDRGQFLKTEVTQEERERICSTMND